MPLTWCIPSLSFQVARPTYIITVDKCCFHSMIFYNLLSVVSSITYAVLNYFLRHPASKACWDLEKCLCWKTQLNGERKCLIYLWCIIQKKYAQLWSICWSMLSCAVFEADPDKTEADPDKTEAVKASPTPWEAGKIAVVRFHYLPPQQHELSEWTPNCTSHACLLTGRTNCHC